MLSEPQVTHKARADGSELMICSSTMSELTLERAGVARSVVLLSTKLSDGSDELKLSRSGHNTLHKEDNTPLSHKLHEGIRRACRPNRRDRLRAMDAPCHSTRSHREERRGRIRCARRVQGQLDRADCVDVQCEYRRHIAEPCECVQ